MSVVIAEESRTVGRRVTKVGPGRKRIQENPAHSHKTFNAQLTTPRKTLQDLSNTVKTPAPSQRQPSHSHKKPVLVTRPTSGKRSKEIPVSGKTRTTVPQQNAPKVEDIELMPGRTSDFSDTTPFVPPTYFKSLTRALTKVTPVPLLADFPELDSLASLSLESDVRPATKRKGPTLRCHNTDFENSPFKDLPPVDFPDFGDL